MRLPPAISLALILASQSLRTPESSSTSLSQLDFAQYRDLEYKFSIHYPRSWAMVEATHPQTRLKAISHNGAGDDDLSVVVTRLPGSRILSPDELVQSIDAEQYLAYLRKSIPGAQLIKYGPTTLSNQAAYYFVTDVTHRPLEIDVPMRQIQVQTAHSGNVYTITFRTSPDLSSELPILFQMILGGFVLWPDVENTSGQVARQSFGEDPRTAARRGAISALLLIALFGLGAGFIRLVLVRRPLSTLWGVGVAGSAWLIMLAVYHLTADVRWPPSWISAGAVVAFFVLTWGTKGGRARSRGRTEFDAPQD